jgi:hypothetical protein
VNLADPRTRMELFSRGLVVIIEGVRETPLRRLLSWQWLEWSLTRRLSCLRQCKSSAVLQIRSFVQTKQLDDAHPQPGRGFKRSLVIFRQPNAMPAARWPSFGDRARVRRRHRDNVPGSSLPHRLVD